MFLRSLEMLRKAGHNNQYPFSVLSIKNLDTIEFKTNVTFFVGENGSGKSTILEAIAYQCGFNTAGAARQMALLRIIKDLDNEAQFIIATHSPILLGYPDAQILNFDDQPIREIRYEDTLHYIITKRFLDNRNKVLNELFNDTDES